MNWPDIFSSVILQITINTGHPGFSVWYDGRNPHFPYTVGIRLWIIILEITVTFGVL